MQLRFFCVRPAGRGKSGTGGVDGCADGIDKKVCFLVFEEFRTTEELPDSRFCDLIFFVNSFDFKGELCWINCRTAEKFFVVELITNRYISANTW